ncbi:MAG: ABC transporter permease subunit [Planctomycetota bacterium]|nr:ABC transporter permease subunit [Planctomycetota bacterium]
MTATDRPQSEPDRLRFNEERIRLLHKSRPQNRAVQVSGGLFVCMALFSLWHLDLQWGRLFADPSEPGLFRFLNQDIRPHVTRQPDWTWADLGTWLLTLLRDYGLRATWGTLLLATAAMGLAGFGGLLLAPLAARTLTVPDPYMGLQNGRRSLLSSAVRSLCLAMRALPEYVLGFLLLALLSGSTWPAVLALALHNAGILGRLFGDSLEDVPVTPMRGLAAGGARPSGLLLFGGAPQAFSRWLAYIFYRFETCVREATVLGMLGVISIGYYAKEMRSRQFYDELFVLVLLGALLVLLADALSGWLRSRLRQG